MVFREVGRWARGMMLGLGVMAGAEGVAEAHRPPSTDNVETVRPDDKAAEVTAETVEKYVEAATGRLTKMLPEENRPAGEVKIRKIFTGALQKMSGQSPRAQLRELKEIEAIGRRKLSAEKSDSSKSSAETGGEKSVIHYLAKEYDDGVSVGIKYLIKIKPGEVDLAIDGEPVGFSAVRYYRGQTYENLRIDESRDIGLQRKMADMRTQTLYLEGRILESLDPSSAEGKAVAHNFKNQLAQFESDFGPTLDLAIFPGVKLIR